MVDGLRIMVLPASTIADIESAGEKIIGRGFGAILYDAGERTGYAIGLHVRDALGATSLKDILALIERGHRERGYGRAEFVSTDFVKGELVVRVHDSPYAEVGQGAWECMLLRREILGGPR